MKKRRLTLPETVAAIEGVLNSGPQSNLVIRRRVLTAALRRLKKLAPVAKLPAGVEPYRYFYPPECSWFKVSTPDLKSNEFKLTPKWFALLEGGKMGDHGERNYRSEKAARAAALTAYNKLPPEDRR